MQTAIGVSHQAAILAGDPARWFGRSHLGSRAKGFTLAFESRGYLQSGKVLGKSSQILLQDAGLRQGHAAPGGIGQTSGYFGIGLLQVIDLNVDIIRSHKDGKLGGNQITAQQHNSCNQSHGNNTDKKIGHDQPIAQPPHQRASHPTEGKSSEQDAVHEGQKGYPAAQRSGGIRRTAYFGAGARKEQEQPAKQNEEQFNAQHQQRKIRQAAPGHETRIGKLPPKIAQRNVHNYGTISDRLYGG